MQRVVTEIVGCERIC